MLLSTIESAAASPGVLVIPPVIVPSKSSRLILNTRRQTIAAKRIGITVMAAPTPNISNPLSWKVATRFLPAEVHTSDRNKSRHNWRNDGMESTDIDMSLIHISEHTRPLSI